MKIIDSHLHLFPQTETWAEEKARLVGYENSIEHLRTAYEQANIVHGVVMGNHGLNVEEYDYPKDLFHYCAAIDTPYQDAEQKTLLPDLYEKVEHALQQEACCGIKLYPGYFRVWLYDPAYTPVYDLCARYDKPVAVHMGLTAMADAELQYSHPFVLDTAAAKHPKTRFVMCHFGNPFLDAAAAVVGKNPNVCADLSGLLEGPWPLEQLKKEQAGYLFLLEAWLRYTGRWDALLFGTDWPIVNLEEYIACIRHVVPEKHWDKVFYENARRTYGL